MLQVGDEGFADVGGQGKRVHPRPLAANPKFSSGPVDVVQPQAGHLVRPQPQTRQQRQDREVSGPHRRRPVERMQKGIDVLAGQGAWQLLSAARHRRHRRGERPVRQPRHVEEAQQRPHPTHDRLHPVDAQLTAPGQDEGGDIAGR